MATVTINGTDYEVYLSIVEMDEYAQATLQSVEWDSLDADTKARYAVLQTRLFDRQVWIGERSDPVQPLAWPRDGLGLSGVTDGVTPQDLLDGAAETQLALLSGTDLINQQSVAQQVRRLKAGSVEIENFRGAEGEPLRFPLAVWELISKYLSVSGNVLPGSRSCGTDGESAFEKGYLREYL